DFLGESPCHSTSPFLMMIQEILTGVAPFNDMRECAVMFAVVSDARPERRSCIPKELYELLYRCWVREPGRRPVIEDVCGELRTRSVGGSSAASQRRRSAVVG